MPHSLSPAPLPASGLRDLTEHEWLKMLGVPRTNEQGSRYPRMLPETLKILSDFYQPFNEQLADLLGDERWLWHLDQPRNKQRKRAAEQGAQAEDKTSAAER